MPDIQSPGKQLIYGKEPNEIGRLLSHITDSAEAAKQLKLLYSTAEIADIIGSGYLTTNRAVDILVDVGFTTATAASVMDDSDCGAGRNAEFLKQMSVVEAYTLLNHTNFTTPEIAKALNYIPTDGAALRTKWRSAYTTRTLKIWVTNGVADLVQSRYKFGGVSDDDSNHFRVCGGQTSAGLTVSMESVYPTDAPFAWTNHEAQAPAGMWDMNTAKQEFGCTGQGTDFLICGGNTTVEPVAISRTIETEEAVYLFSVGGDLNTAIRLHAVAGATSSAAISFGGEDGTNVPTNATEKYNGTAWAVDNNLNVAVKYCGAAGTASAGLCGGGGNAVQSMNTQEYNGTVWSVGGNLNTHVGAHGMCGTQTCAISFGGQAGGGTSITAETEEYNGSAWSTSGIGDLNTARWYHEGGGRTHGFTTGGLAPGLTGETEEYR